MARKTRFLRSAPFWASVGLLSLLAIVFGLSNPASKLAIYDAYPYVLSIKPSVGYYAGTINMEVLSLDKAHNIGNTTIIVVSPDGGSHKITELGEDKIILQFPQGFVGATTTQLGDYGVYVIPAGTEKPPIPIGKFMISVSPELSAFSQFIFGSGLAITLPVIISILTFLYQYISKKRDEAAKRNDTKLEWVVKNMKSYFDLIARSGAIYSRFEGSRHNQFVTTDNLRLEMDKDDLIPLLYYIIKFYDGIIQFSNKSGAFYFDDLRAETFIQNTEGLVLMQMDDIFEDYSELKQFLRVKSLGDLKDHPNSARYIELLAQYLKEPKNVRSFYMNHMAFSWLLFLEVNKNLVATYTKTEDFMLNLNNQIEPYMPVIQQYLDEHNSDFFNKNEKMYYRPFVKVKKRLALPK